MVLSLRDSTVESNNKQSMDSITTQSEDTTDFVDQLRCYETKNRRVLTAREIQNFELAHNEYVMNHFMYHQQFNSIVEYETSFLQLKRWAETWSEESFDEDWVVRRFVVGLKEEIRNYVNLWRPDSLQRAIVLAKWQELCLVDHQNVLAKIEDPSSTVTQVCAESIHAKVISVSHSDYSSPNLSTNTAAGTICANKKGFPVADKVFDKKLEPRTTNHQNEIEGDGVTIEGVFDPGGKMMSCFTYMKKNDDMNRPSSSIVNHEYSIKYLSAMDYSGPWVSYGSSKLALVTLGYMSTTIIVFPVPLLTKLSGSVIQPLPISVLAVEKLLYASKFELQVAMPSIVDSQSRATRGSSTEIASIFVLRGVHNIMGVQKFSSEEIKSQNYRTTAIHGLTYEFDECDYISSDEFTVIYDLGWFLEDIIQILWVDSYVLPNIFQIDYNHSNSYVVIVEVFNKYLDLIPHSKAATFGDVLEHNSVTCLKGCDVYVADSRMLIGRICLIWWTKVDSVISNMGLFQVKMSSDAFQFVRDMGMIPLIVTKSKYGTPIVSIWCLVAGEIFLSHIKFQFIGFHIDLNFQDMSYLLNNFVALRKNGQTLIAWEAYMGHELGEASMCKFVPRGILRLAAIGNQVDHHISFYTFSSNITILQFLCSNYVSVLCNVQFFVGILNGCINSPIRVYNTGTLYEVLPILVVLAIRMVHSFVDHSFFWLIVSHLLTIMPSWVLCKIHPNEILSQGAGLISYGVTFFISTYYMRATIRLFTLTVTGVIYVEKGMRGRLEWRLTYPTPYVFLVGFIKALVSNKPVMMEHMAYFLAELDMMNYIMVMYCLSMVVALAVNVNNIFFGMRYSNNAWAFQSHN